MTGARAAAWKRMAAIGIVCAAFAALASGCSTTARVESYTLPVDPATTLLAVDVENVRGSVEVRTTAKDDAAHITAHLDATYKHGGPDAEAVHADTRLDVTVEQAEGRGVVRVRAANPEASSRHAIHLLIEVPRCDGVRIVNRGGTVEVVGARGSAEITNYAGAIEVRSNHPVTEDIRLLNTDGPIFLQMATGSTGAIDLATLDGESVLRDFSGNADELIASREALVTTLGDARNTILARTNDGDVRVWVMENPESLTRIVKSSMPDWRDYVFKEGSRRHTRNLPDDEPPRKRGTRANPGG